ncbi:hypothetical protein M885DRAFT_620868 [Pelagophyceae sp. CCMP2097]|nr:hypothetical protein M885DRAFT_620868 [Pelagophyceae sp. CCMP2097]
MQASLRLLALLAFSSPCRALVPVRRFSEVAPIKGAMLVKSWQGLLQEVDQKVGVLPDITDRHGQVGVLRFGDELKRRTHCKRLLERFYAGAFELALADRTKDPRAARLNAKCFQSSESGGLGVCVFASLAEGGGASTLSMVQKGAAWSLIELAVHPEERNLATVQEAEVATLEALRSAALIEGATGLRVSTAMLPALALALAGDRDWLEDAEVCSRLGSLSK